jgi:drug/metabolite transporter (DMT)-like permease
MADVLLDATPSEAVNVSKAPVRISRERVYVVLALGIVCIALSAIFVKLAVGVPGTVSAFYRVTIAAVALAIPFARGQTRKRRMRGAKSGLGWRIWTLAVSAGVFFALDLAFWNTSLGLTTAANATLLGNDAPLVVGLGAFILFHERPRASYWLGLAIALLGMSVIVGWDVLSRSPLSAGDLLAMLAGVFYAGYLLATQRIRARMDTLPSLWVASATGTVLLLAFILATGQALTGYSVNAYGALLGLGLVSQLVGWLAINYALGHMPASVVSVTLLAQPILTALFAVPLLQESLETHQIVGGLIALGGIFLVNRGVGKQNQRHSPPSAPLDPTT